MQLGPGRSDSKDQIWFLCPSVIEVIKVERPEYRGQGLLETGRQISTQKQTCEPRKQGRSLCKGPGSSWQHSVPQMETKQGTESAQGAASTRAAAPGTQDPRPGVRS